MYKRVLEAHGRAAFQVALTLEYAVTTKQGSSAWKDYRRLMDKYFNFEKYLLKKWESIVKEHESLVYDFLLMGARLDAYEKEGEHIKKQLKAMGVTL